MSNRTNIVCRDCAGTGQIAGRPSGNGLALAVACPTCHGSGRR